MAQKKSSIEQELERSWDLWRLIPIADVKPEYCRNLLRNSQFTDHFFPPTQRSIQGDSHRSFSREALVWKRPREFLRGEPKLFEGKIEAKDVKQGVLGDCWFLGAVSALAQFEGFIEAMFPDRDALMSCGMYRVVLYKNGERHTVVVDDYIPCNATGPVFSRCNGNELWAIILEKVYAKLHGSYASLLGGLPQDSFTDLSGCPTWSYQFKRDSVRQMIDNGKLWDSLLMWHSRRYCLATSSKPGEEMELRGIVPAHAYTVMRVVQEGPYQLLQLRNPWGRFEWTGAWSDNSREWTTDLRQRINPGASSDDGLFWLSFRDLLDNFDSLEVCKVDRYSDQRFKAHIVRDETVGAKATHYLYIEARQSTEVIFGVHQEDERSVGVEEYRRYMDLGLVLYEITQRSKRILSFAELRDEREAFLEITLQPGTYMLVVVSTGAALRRPADCRPERFRFATENNDLDPYFLGIVKDLFRRFDQNISQELEYEEFNKFATEIGFPMTRDVFNDKVRARFTSYDLGITLQGFIELFQEELRKGREPRVREWLLRLGYDQDCYSIQSRAVVLSVQSKGNLTVTRNQLEDAQNYDLLLDTWKELSVLYGSTKELTQGLNLFSLSHSSANAQSYLIWNHNPEPWSLNMDFSNSDNVEFVLNSERRVQKVVPPKCWIIVQHLKALRSASSARFGYHVTSQRANS